MRLFEVLRLVRLIVLGVHILVVVLNVPLQVSHFLVYTLKYSVEAHGKHCT